MFAEVVAFNEMIGNARKEKPALLDEKECDWLYSALQEEAEEFLDAHEDQPDVSVAVDSLIDSIYFAIGGLHRLGLTPAQMQGCFDAVHNANLTKKRGVVGKRPNDGTIADAVKPEDFKDPVVLIREILNAG